ncbi:hypothetical protein ACFVYF_05115 [Streptomyces sp. NPDC058274]|uniref:hypothetical protein n=1 Tax=Streptomyces sp. NPDC058274 TaxID=3346416 RepID=UPI0036E40EFC
MTLEFQSIRMRVAAIFAALIALSSCDRGTHVTGSGNTVCDDRSNCGIPGGAPKGKNFSAIAVDIGVLYGYDHASPDALSSSEVLRRMNPGGLAGTIDLVPVDNDLMKIDLTAGQNSAVVNNVRIIDLECSSPISETGIFAHGEGGTEDIGIKFNVDDPKPELLVWGGPDDKSLSGERYFAGHSVTVAAGESEIIVALARTRTKFCTWNFEVDYQDGGEVKSVRVQGRNSRGKEIERFQLTAAEPASFFNRSYDFDQVLQELQGS